MLMVLLLLLYCKRYVRLLHEHFYPLWKSVGSGHAWYRPESNDVPCMLEVLDTRRVNDLSQSRHTRTEPPFTPFENYPAIASVGKAGASYCGLRHNCEANTLP